MYAKDKVTIVDRREMLKVKLKALAAESKIIRFQELRTVGALREELYLHRIGVVRQEARCTHIAYAIVRGRLRRCGDACWLTGTEYDKVKKMVEKYGGKLVVMPPHKMASNNRVQLEI